MTYVKCKVPECWNDMEGNPYSCHECWGEARKLDILLDRDSHRKTFKPTHDKATPPNIKCRYCDDYRDIGHNVCFRCRDEVVTCEVIRCDNPTIDDGRVCCQDCYAISKGNYAEYKKSKETPEQYEASKQYSAWLKSQPAPKAEAVKCHVEDCGCDATDMKWFRGARVCNVHEKEWRECYSSTHEVCQFVEQKNAEIKKAKETKEHKNLCMFDDCKKEHDNRWWCDGCFSKASRAYDDWKFCGSPKYSGCQEDMPYYINHYNEQLKKGKQPMPVTVNVDLNIDEAQLKAMGERIQKAAQEHIAKGIEMGALAGSVGHALGGLAAASTGVGVALAEAKSGQIVGVALNGVKEGQLVTTKDVKPMTTHIDSSNPKRLKVQWKANHLTTIHCKDGAVKITRPDGSAFPVWNNQRVIIGNDEGACTVENYGTHTAFVTVDVHSQDGSKHTMMYNLHNDKPAYQHESYDTREKDVRRQLQADDARWKIYLAELQEQITLASEADGEPLNTIPTIKEVQTMSKSNELYTMPVLKEDATDAGYRVAGRQFTKLVKDPFVALLCRGLQDDSPDMRAKVAAFLNTEFGKAFFQSALSIGLSALPNSAGGIPARMARELRTEAMTNVGDQVADVLMGPLREVASLYLKGIPQETPALDAQSQQVVKVEIPVEVKEEVKR